MRKIVMRDCKTKEPIVVEYDETAPCKICGNPVVSASMGGLDICPSCDCGYFRDGREIANTPYAHLYLLKAYAEIKEKVIDPVPTFQQYEEIAVSLMARGVNMDIWKAMIGLLELQRKCDEETLPKMFDKTEGMLVIQV